jgi:hypothetical protein
LRCCSWVRLYPISLIPRSDSRSFWYGELTLPRMVSTPLWLSRPDLMEQFGYNPEHTITPERVAEDMYELITNGEYPGGTCLENSIGGPRVLGTWNVEQPKSLGTSVLKEVRDRMNRKMVEVMRRERGAKL